MHNALEEVMGEVFDQVASGRARFCDCPQCRDDVITLALNQARPRYVSRSLIGSAVTRVALSHEQARAELAVVVLDAMRRVAARPRHPRARAVEGGAPG
ncbi:MAG: late competence development ComFB family protein [Gemmatimonadetes bacterium]|jgi:competence protein ComFB|nr:late competence development ComFB family protein [Gemmatimonadota bacterium]MCC6774395.1 late competence development ComFB family protein [Gemmatimonadaceae bacterium]